MGIFDEKYDTEYFKLIDKSYKNMIDSFRFYHIVSLLKKFKRKKSSSLDVGCGTGVYLPILAKIYKNVLGIDFADEAIKFSLEKVRNLENVKLSKVNLDSKLNLENSSYDFILCTEVLEHLKFPEKLIKELKGVCKRNGIIVLTVPNNTFLSVEYLREKLTRNIDPKHYHRFTISSIICLLRKYDYKINKIITITHSISILLFYLFRSKKLAVCVDKIISKIPILNLFGRDILIVAEK